MLSSFLKCDIVKVRMKKHRKRKLLIPRRERVVLKALIVGLGVVMFWRGAWGLMDLYLIPQNEHASFVASIVLGSAILATTHYFVKELLG